MIGQDIGKGIGQGTGWALVLIALGSTACSTEPLDPQVDACRAATRPGCAGQPSDYGDPLVHLGRGEGPTFLEMTDVVVDYPYVYGCTGVRGLAIWDASDDEPSLLGQGMIGSPTANLRFPRCQHVGYDRENKRLLVTNRGDEVQPQPFLWAFDVSDPREVVELGGWQPTSSVEGVVLDGERVYAALHTSGIRVLGWNDDPEKGRYGFTALSGYTDAESNAWQVVKQGAWLFTAEGSTGLRVYQLDGDELTLAATLGLDGSTRDLVTDGERAVLAVSSALAVVNISDPAAPALLGSVATTGQVLAVAFAGPDTIVTAQWDEIRAYDISDPLAIRQVFSESVPTSAAFSRVLAVDADVTTKRVFAGEWEGMHAFAMQDVGASPEMDLSVGRVEFGSVAGGQNDDAVVIVHNSGDRPLRVHDIVGADGISASADCFEVQPGEDFPLEVTYSARTDTELRTALRICTDDPDESEVLLPMSANVPGRGVGDNVPPFRLIDTQGKAWSSAELRGQVVVLAYFATF